MVSEITAILSGPTGCGKTNLSIEFCKQRGVEIINADSILIYRGMEIGSAKPTVPQRADVPHHLIDTRNPDDPYTASDFVRDVRQTLALVQKRGKRALVVGGTGFYLKALLYGLWDAPPTNISVREKLEMQSNDELYQRLNCVDAQASLKTGKNDRYRLIRALEIYLLSGKTPTQLEAAMSTTPDPSFRLLVIDRENDDLYARVDARTRKMLNDGLVEETRALMKQYNDARALKAVGYAQTRNFIDKIAPSGRKVAVGEQGLIDEICLATRQLVKQQRTWFRGEKSAQHYLLDSQREALWIKLCSIYEKN